MRSATWRVSRSAASIGTTGFSGPWIVTRRVPPDELVELQVVHVPATADLRRVHHDEQAIRVQVHPRDMVAGPASRRSATAASTSSPTRRDSARGQQMLARFPDAERVEVDSHWQHPRAARQRRQRRPLGPDQDRDARARASRSRCPPGPTAARRTSSRRPRRTAAPWRARTATSRGARATRTRSRCSRTSSRSPATCARHVDAAGRQAGAGPGRPDGVGLRHRREQRLLGRRAVSDNVADLVATFRGLPTAKASFATKHVNRDLLGLDPQGRTRIRFSLMPERDAKLLDVRTCPIARAHRRDRRLRRRPGTRCTSTSRRS